MLAVIVTIVIASLFLVSITETAWIYILALYTLWFNCLYKNIDKSHTYFIGCYGLFKPITV